MLSWQLFLMLNQTRDDEHLLSVFSQGFQGGEREISSPPLQCALGRCLGRGSGGGELLTLGAVAVSCSDPLLIQLQGFNKNSMKASNSISQVVEDLL